MTIFSPENDTRPVVDLQVPAMIVDEFTGDMYEVVDSASMQTLAREDGTLTDAGSRHFDYRMDITHDIPALQSRLDSLTGFSFRGGNQCDILEDVTLGGSQPVVGREIAAHELEFLSGVVREIFDGRHDLGAIDVEFLTDTNTGMPQTLRSLFTNEPGHGDGVSSLRHIFKGDKRGGLHVPAFAQELEVVRKNPDTDLWKPFNATVSVNGATKLRIDTTERPRLVPAQTSMFPAGLDSLTVLQCVIDAWENKAQSNIVISRRGSDIYEVPITVPGVMCSMTVRLITDTDTPEEKIRTAFPVVS